MPENRDAMEKVVGWTVEQLCNGVTREEIKKRFQTNAQGIADEIGVPVMVLIKSLETLNVSDRELELIVDQAFEDLPMRKFFGSIP